MSYTSFYSSYLVSPNRYDPFTCDSDGNVIRRHYTSVTTNTHPRRELRRVHLANLPWKETPAGESELSSVLHVKNVDLHIEENTKAHHTDKFECTTKRTDEGFGSEPELVIRRGQTFKVTLTFDRPFSLENDDLQLMFETGKMGLTYKATYSRFDVDETKKYQYKPNEWGAKLLEKSGNTATIEIHSACDCAIGYWNLMVLTKSKVTGDQIKVFQYDFPEEITILFNPWCPDDDVYMDNKGLLDEYILNDHGCLYRGEAFYQKGKPWNFGQFEDGILEISLYLVKKCLKGNQLHRLSDPVKVSRIISQVVNCNDSDNGVLCGRWDGKYDDGESPSNWFGSVRILQQYWKTKEPVKYGQCWVFSGLTTTVCRALGIPALSVTNFSSAHDTDDNNVIEMYYRKDEKGNLEFLGGDSIWNYHLWNQVWMKRRDLAEYKNKFDGWQAIDATPQEMSGGVFACGPAPMAAIKEGYVNIPYDTGFVFTEVNGDEIHLCRDGFHVQRLKLKTDSVGKSISTKKADGKKFRGGFWDRQRDDVTDMYKHPNDSVQNRNAVMKAAIGARHVSEFYTGEAEKEDVKFKLLHEAKLIYGQDVKVKLMAENTSQYPRTLGNVCFRFLNMKYTGQVDSLLKADQKDINEELKPGKVYEYTSVLPVKDYESDVDETLSMTIQVFATVEGTKSRPLQNCIKSHVVTFQEPEIEVKMPSSVKVGDDFKATFTFDNPLDKPLTDCSAGYEGRGFKHVTGVKQKDVPALGKAKVKFTLKATKKGHYTLTFKFNSKQLQFLSGTGEIEVK